MFRRNILIFGKIKNYPDEFFATTFLIVKAIAIYMLSNVEVRADVHEVIKCPPS
jgi:hypothetical protein